MGEEGRRIASWIERHQAMRRVADLRIYPDAGSESEWAGGRAHCLDRIDAWTVRGAGLLHACMLMGKGRNATGLLHEGEAGSTAPTEAAAKCVFQTALHCDAATLRPIEQTMPQQHTP